MSEAKVRCNFTLNPEYNKLLNDLKDKTGKEKSQIFTEAIELALEGNLPPAQFRWNKKSHSSYHVDLPVGDIDRAKKVWGGKLTTAAVAGILEIAKAEGIEVTKTGIYDTEEELHETKQLREKVSQKLRPVIRSSPKEGQKRVTDSTSASKNVKMSLRKLLYQLEYFKKGTESDRKIFREIIDPLEVGYITSILKALFEEEAFQRWVLATEFKPRGNKK